MSEKIEVPDRYYGFWPDEDRQRAREALLAVVERFDIQTRFGADAAIEQLWNALTVPSPQENSK